MMKTFPGNYPEPDGPSAEAAGTGTSDFYMPNFLSVTGAGGGGGIPSPTSDDEEETTFPFNIDSIISPHSE